MFCIDKNAEDKYIITFDDSRFYGTKGSFNVVAARVLGLSYANYLRYCRDVHGGTIHGRTGYSSVYFNEEPKELLKILKENWKKVNEHLKGE